MTHFTSIHGVSEVIPAVEGRVLLLQCYAGVNVDHACGFELGRDINMFIFTCAWLHESSYHLLCLGLICVATIKKVSLPLNFKEFITVNQSSYLHCTLLAIFANITRQDSVIIIII